MQNFNSNPNQRNITINKEITNNDNYYTKINLLALQNAMKNLTPKAFELWIYLGKNKDKHSMWLSKVDFLTWANLSVTSYYGAFNELVSKGYLVKRNNNSNNYDFYEYPNKDKV